MPTTTAKVSEVVVEGLVVEVGVLQEGREEEERSIYQPDAKLHYCI